MSSEDIERRLAAIEARNKRVETDKAWEVSFTRRFLIAGLTYLVIGLYLVAIDKEQPWVNAFVPAIGFFVSTLVVSFAKSIWSKRR